ncbi:hypothetical protein OAH91_05100 [Emcibacteraceae bacterium]|nr:hypothetical protein [Emcibacteraceae bacterium]
MRRVVVTGLGLVTPLASGLEKSWKRLIAGQSGAGSITRFNPVGLSAQVACEVPLGDGTNGTFNADDWMEPKNRKRVDDFILYGMAAADMAMADSGYIAETIEQKWRSGALIGAGIGGLPGIEKESSLWRVFKKLILVHRQKLRHGCNKKLTYTSRTTPTQ